MTRDEILKLEAGDELDALIAEKVMGWHSVEDKWGYKAWYDAEDRFQCGIHKGDSHEDSEDFHILHWHPSSSILWAWEVVEKANAFFLEQPQNYDDKTWSASISISSYLWDAEADTAPLAICRAALLAVTS